MNLEDVANSYAGFGRSAQEATEAFREWVEALHDSAAAPKWIVLDEVGEMPEEMLESLRRRRQWHPCLDLYERCRIERERRQSFGRPLDWTASKPVSWWRVVP